MSATMEGMVGEKRIVPERSEWFRSSGLIGTTHRQGVYRMGSLIDTLARSAIMRTYTSLLPTHVTFSALTALSL